MPIRCADIGVATVGQGDLTGSVRAGGCRMWRRVERQQVSGVLEIRATGGTEEPVVADLGEAPRKHVFENARDERVHRERQPSGLVRARVGVAEGDATVREGLNSMIGEGDVIDIAGEIARRVLPAPDLLDVHGPRARPHGGIERAKQLGPLKGRAHLCAKVRGEHVSGHEEARRRRLDQRGAIG